VRGRLTPALPKEYVTNPEQSKPLGVFPAHLYFTPKLLFAAAIAFAL
jgi:hypothetical protein